MNADEAVKLCRYVKACCPQQAIDEYTPLAWADHLEPYPYEDAKAAAKELTAKQPFVTVAELLVVIRRERARRIDLAGADLTPPAGMTDAEERAWLGDARRRAASGLPVVQREEGDRSLEGMRALMPKPEPVTATPQQRDPGHAQRLAAARAEVAARGVLVAEGEVA